MATIERKMLEPTVRLNTAHILLISFIAAMGGLLFGYDWVLIGGAKPFFEPFFGISTDRVVDGTATVVTDETLSGWAASFPWFVAWRICGGVAIGMASNLSPIYIAEVAPASIRGRLVAINQLTIAIGILAAQLVNWGIARRFIPETKGKSLEEIEIELVGLPPAEKEPATA